MSETWEVFTMAVKSLAKGIVLLIATLMSLMTGIGYLILTLGTLFGLATIGWFIVKAIVRAIF